MQNEVKKKGRRMLMGIIVAEGILLVLLILLCLTMNWDRIGLLQIVTVFLIVAAVIRNVVLWRMGPSYSKLRDEYTQNVAGAKEEAEELMREVVGNISHDLKTPLTAIRGYSQGILDGIAATPERNAKYVTTIRNKADDMSALVDELSFFAKIYKNDIQYEFVQVDANEYFSQCISSLSLDLETKCIDLVYQYLAEKNAQILVDKGKFKRVVNNIVGNAAKYMKEGHGFVFVRVVDEEENIVVQVMDNGVGIKEEEIPMIFDRFYRTDSSRNSSTGGSGLGLSIARKIVDDHKGKIWAESKRGEGTRISFSLPKCRRMEEKQ